MKYMDYEDAKLLNDLGFSDFENAKGMYLKTDITLYYQINEGEPAKKGDFIVKDFFHAIDSYLDCGTWVDTSDIPIEDDDKLYSYIGIPVVTYMEAWLWLERTEKAHLGLTPVIKLREVIGYPPPEHVSRTIIDGYTNFQGDHFDDIEDCVVSGVKKILHNL